VSILRTRSMPSSKEIRHISPSMRTSKYFLPSMINSYKVKKRTSYAFDVVTLLYGLWITLNKPLFVLWPLFDEDQIKRRAVYYLILRFKVFSLMQYQASVACRQLLSPDNMQDNQTKRQYNYWSGNRWIRSI